MKHYKMIYVQTSKNQTYNSLECQPKRARRLESVLISQIQSGSRCKIGCNSSIFMGTGFKFVCDYNRILFQVCDFSSEGTDTLLIS